MKKWIFLAGAKIQLTKGKTQVINVNGKPYTFSAKLLSQGRLEDKLTEAELSKLTPDLIEILEHGVDARQRLLDIESSLSVTEESSDRSVSYFPVTVSRYVKLEFIVYRCILNLSADNRYLIFVLYLSNYYIFFSSIELASFGS